MKKYKWRSDLNFEENRDEKKMYEEIQDIIYGRKRRKNRNKLKKSYIYFFLFTCLTLSLYFLKILIK